MRRTCLIAITVSVIFSTGLFACRKPPKPPDAQSYYGLTSGTNTETAAVQRKAGWTQKEILISYCCSAAPEEKSMLAASSEHFNMVPAWEQTLDFAAKHGVKVMLEHGLLSPGTMQSPDQIAALDALIDRVKKHPALESYYVLDEPKATDFSLLQKMVQHLRERDPKHLAFITMLPISHALTLKPGETHISLYQEYLQRFVRTVRPDLLNYDYYHFFQTKEGKPYDDFHYFLNLSLVREAARADGIPFMNIIQCSTYLKYWRMPNAAELRWLVYTTLAYGGRGFSYFLYWGPAKYGGLYRDGKPIPLIDSVSKINNEIAILSPVLMNLRSTEVYHSEPLPAGTVGVPANAPVQIISPGQFVLGLFESSTGKGSFMMVNRDYRSASRALVRIKGKTKIREFSRIQRKWIEFVADEHNNFAIDLEPGDGRLFEY